MDLEAFLDSVSAPAAIYETERGTLNVQSYRFSDFSEPFDVSDINYILFSDNSYQLTHRLSSVYLDWKYNIYCFLWILAREAVTARSMTVKRKGETIWKGQVNHEGSFEQWCARANLGLGVEHWRVP